MTKHAGLEGMSILAKDRPDLLHFFDASEIQQISRWSGDLSVLPESRVLRSWARFMHDPTEGGVLGGLGEMALLSPFALAVDPEAIPCHPLTRRAAEALGFDPLHLISSGALLGILPEENCKEAIRILKAQGIDAAIIGHVKEEPRGEEIPFSSREELWGLLARS